MKALIQIQQRAINDQQHANTVSARELHRFMEVGRDFSSWIKGRIEEYGYEKGRDYVIIFDSPNSVNQNRRVGANRRSIEYHLTLDMAKELAMVERNPMGKVARKYFIHCERAVQEILPHMAGQLLATNPVWQRILRYRVAAAASLSDRIGTNSAMATPHNLNSFRLVCFPEGIDMTAECYDALAVDHIDRAQAMLRCLSLLVDGQRGELPIGSEEGQGLALILGAIQEQLDEALVRL